ncbi:MAG: cation:proton antiporter [Gammaproteobacteria bacterium]|nr:MAG: cation:proton antiporter [Gammaproteobacteria bacterium]
MSASFDPAWLWLAPAVPLAGALLTPLAARRPALRDAWALVSALGLFVCVAWLAGAWWRAGAPVLRSEGPEWWAGVVLAVHVEPLSMLFASVASLLWVVTTVYSIGYMRANREAHQGRYYFCFALALAATMLVAFAANLVTLFVAYELLTLATYPLVAHKGDERARQGARTYLAILLASSMGLFLPAIVWTHVLAGGTEFVSGGLLAGRLSPAVAAALLSMFVLGVGKAAVMPVHRWLPAAMVAPTPVSALLHAVAVVKAGVFTLCKIVFYIFGPAELAALGAQEAALLLAGFTVVAASLVALRQVEFKRLLAYSTVSQLGYVVMAALLLAPLSRLGAVLHIAAHAFGKITLFFAAGAVYTALHKTRVDELAGVGRRMPWTMAAFTVGALSMIGLPPTAGFVSKWFILAGAMDWQSVFVGTVLVLSTALNAGYFLPIVCRAFFREGDGRGFEEAPWPMVAAITATAALTVGVFAAAGPLIDLARMSVEVSP